MINGKLLITHRNETFDIPNDIKTYSIHFDSVQIIIDDSKQKVDIYYTDEAGLFQYRYFSLLSSWSENIKYFVRGEIYDFQISFEVNEKKLTKVYEIHKFSELDNPRWTSVSIHSSIEKARCKVNKLLKNSTHTKFDKSNLEILKSSELSRLLELYVIDKYDSFSIYERVVDEND